MKPKPLLIQYQSQIGLQFSLFLLKGGISSFLFKSWIDKHKQMVIQSNIKCTIRKYESCMGTKIKKLNRCNSNLSRAIDSCNNSYIFPISKGADLLLSVEDIINNTNIETILEGCLALIPSGCLDPFWLSTVKYKLKGFYIPWCSRDLTHFLCYVMRNVRWLVHWNYFN